MNPRLIFDRIFRDPNIPQLAFDPKWVNAKQQIRKDLDLGFKPGQVAKAINPNNGSELFFIGSRFGVFAVDYQPKYVGLELGMIDYVLPEKLTGRFGDFVSLSVSRGICGIDQFMGLNDEPNIGQYIENIASEFRREVA
jgi:hypothetical protein